MTGKAGPAARELAPSDAAKRVRQSLGIESLGSWVDEAATLRAAALRGVLWSLSQHGTTPVYVTRLLNAARRVVEAALNNSITELQDTAQPEHPAEDFLRVTLDELELLGDLAQLPGGYWLPAPLRTIVFPESNRWLLVGGLPSFALGFTVLDKVKHSCAARSLLASPKSVRLIVPSQSRDAWLRLPRESLDVWTNRQLHSPMSYVGQVDQNIDYYMPDKGSQHYYRWVTAAGELADGRYLLRIKHRAGDVQYYVGEVRAAKLQGIAADAVEDVRRLMYGIDALKNRRVEVIVRSDQSIHRFELRSELPAPEQQLLTALGQVERNADGKYYPRCWRIPAQQSASIKQLLQRLDIKVASIGVSGK